MFTRILLVFFGLAFSACATSAVSPQPARSGYAPVNGLRMYYEVYGKDEGVPLVLLHGGGSTIDVAWGRILPFLARGRRVIALEEQGHGRTSDRDAPVRHESSADDVAALLEFLHVERADVFGFSNGAGNALQLAIRHPDRVRKLIFASYMTQAAGAPPQFWEFMRHQANFENMPQPLKDAFLKVNPDPRKLQAMCEKDIDRMRHFKDVPDRDLKSLRAQTLVLLGDRDVPTPQHAVELSHEIPGARLVILPGGHGEYLGELLTMRAGSRAPELTAGLIEEFLAAP